MPANQGNTPYDWSPVPDFHELNDVTHCNREPQSAVELAEWLDDTSALPEAEVYRHIKPERMIETQQEAAMSMWPDMELGQFTADEALAAFRERQVRQEAADALTQASVGQVALSGTVH